MPGVNILSNAIERHSQECGIGTDRADDDGLKKGIEPWVRSSCSSDAGRFGAGGAYGQLRQ